MKKELTLISLFFLVVNMLIPSIMSIAVEKDGSKPVYSLLDKEDIQITYTVEEEKGKLVWDIGYDITNKENDELILDLSQNQTLITLIEPSKDGEQLKENSLSIKLLAGKNEGHTIFETEQIASLHLAIKLGSQHKGMSQNFGEFKLQAPEILPVVGDKETSPKLPDTVEEAVSYEQPVVDKKELVEVDETDNGPKAYAAPVKQSLSINRTIPSYQDLFTYDESDNMNGSLKEGSHRYANGNKDESNFVWNYPFYGSYQPIQGEPVKEYINADQKFESGYHSYTNNGAGVLTKKIVKPIENEPNRFEVELDVIGHRIQTIKPVDVVFVVDKSSSMVDKYLGSVTRWDALKKAFNLFSNELLNSQSKLDIRVGLAGFGSVSKKQRNNPYIEIEKFNHQFFTNSLDELRHSKLMSNSPYQSGTPMFLGIEAGMDMLNLEKYGARKEAKKVLIFLTDGEPTFGYNSKKFTGLPRNDNDWENSNGVIRYTLPYIDNDKAIYYGVGNTSGMWTKDGYIDFIEQTKKRMNFKLQNSQDISRYAISLGIDEEKVNGILSTIGTRYSAQSESDLMGVLSDIKNDVLSNQNALSKGTIIDPMSDYISIIPNTIETKELILKNEQLSEQGHTQTKDAKVLVTKNGNHIDRQDKTPQDNVELKVNNLSLSADDTQRYGYRLRYQVELKPEFRDAEYYPANKGTYVYDGHNKAMGFAVPSVKAPIETVDLPVEKRWAEEIEGLTTRPDNINIELRSQVGSGEWKEEKDHILTLSEQNDWQGKFTKLPKYKDNLPVTYEAVELPAIGYDSKTSIERIAGPDIKNDTVVIITNSLQKINWELIKKDKVTNQPLGSATFKLSRLNGTKWEYFKGDIVSEKDTGKIKLTEMPIGQYRLEEVKAPTGYLKLKAPITFKVDMNDEGKLVVDELVGISNGNSVYNEPILFSLLIKKSDFMTNKELSGAKFTLTKKGVSIKPNDESTLSFEELKAGTYELSEIKAPKGYALLPFKLILTIDNTGEITLTDNVNQPVSKDWIKEVKQDNVIHLEIKNVKKGILPSTGGKGMSRYLILSLIFVVTGSGIGLSYLVLRRKGLI